MPALNQLPDGCPEDRAAFAQRNFAAEINHGDITHFAARALQ
jgi:hypothetical protein